MSLVAVRSYSEAAGRDGATPGVFFEHRGWGTKKKIKRNEGRSTRGGINCPWEKKWAQGKPAIFVAYN